MHLSFLAPLYKRPGPFATVYLDTSRNREDAPSEIALRWRDARVALEDAGCPSAMLAALDDAVADDRGVPGRHSRMVVAADDGIAFADELPVEAARSHGTLGPLPDVAPYLAARGEPVAYLQVVVDRVGGDVEAVTSGGDTRRLSVDGETLHLRKVPDGDWAQARYQRRAENRWAGNAAEVARLVRQEAARVGAEVIVLAGDVRARAELLDALPAAERARVVQTRTGGRAAGAAPAPLEAEVRRVVDEMAARHVTAVAAEFRELEGTGRTVAGLPECVGALRVGRAETLLLNNEPHQCGRVWVGPDALEVAVDPDDLTAEGEPGPLPVRADAAMVRAQVGADGGLVTMPHGELPLLDGVGAILRW